MSWFLTLIILYSGEPGILQGKGGFAKKGTMFVDTFRKQRVHLFLYIDLVWHFHMMSIHQCQRSMPYLVNTYLDMRKRQVHNGTMTCRHHHGWLQKRKLLHFCIKKKPEKAYLKHSSRMLVLHFLRLFSLNQEMFLRPELEQGRLHSPPSRAAAINLVFFVTFEQKKTSSVIIMTKSIKK